MASYFSADCLRFMDNPYLFPLASARQPTRVLLTTDCIGGAWTFALELTRGLRANGVHVLLATMGRDLTASQRADVIPLEHCTVFESTFRLEWMEDPWEDVDTAARWLLELEDEWRPDVVHCNTLAHAALNWRAPVVLTVHSCVYSWFRAVKGHSPPAQQWGEYFRRTVQGIIGADAVVTPTAAMKRALNTYPVSTAHVEVIPNGRTDFAFSDQREKRQQILGVGRFWDEGKNARLLDRIAPELSWPVLLAGEIGFPGTITESLTLLGQLSACELEGCLRETSIFAHPAFYEPFGFAPLEAALAGCALVLSDIPSLREVWGEGNALFVHPRDEHGWIDALEWLSSDPARYTEYGSRAQQRARTFTREKMSDAYFDLYARSMAARRPALTCL